MHLPEAPGSDLDRYDTFRYELTAERRDDLGAYLDGQGIGTLVQWGKDAIHHFRNLGFSQECPPTDRFFERCIMLPMNLFISNEDVQYVANAIRNFYGYK